MSKEEIEKAIVQNEDIITYKADKDFRGLTSSEKTLLENNRKIKEYIGQLEQENNKQNKIIDEMAEYLAIIRDCPNEDKGANLDCENRCSNDDSLYAECWKQYFEKKVDEE